MALLSAHNLSCCKRDRLLFDALSFSLDAGELLYLKGPNGAGKTSLLRILVGLSQPSSGEVRFQQQAISANPHALHQELVYFAHKLGINPVLSALENLRFWCQQQRLQVADEHIMQVLTLLGLVGLEDLAAINLSAGQQRRVALARFWLKPQASLWVLDEPYTALDVAGIALLEQHMLSHLKQGGCVLMTSHQQPKLDYITRELHLEYQI